MSNLLNVHLLIIVLLLAGAGYVAWVIVWYVRSKNRWEEQWEELKQELDLLEHETKDQTLVGEREGIEFLLEWNSAGDNRYRASITLKNESFDVPEVLFRKETYTDRIFKFFGVTREYSASRMEFDRAIYIEGEQESIPHMLWDEQLRSVVHQIIDGPTQKLDIGPDAVVCRMEGKWKKVKNYLSVESIRTHIELLATLSDALNRAEERISSQFENHEDRANSGLNIGYLLLAAIALLSLAAEPSLHLINYYPTLTSELHWISFYVAMGLMAVILLGALLRVKGTSTAHHVLIGLFLGLAIFLTPVVMAGIMFSNGYLDDSFTELRRARVQSIWKDDGTHKMDYPFNFIVLRADR